MPLPDALLSAFDPVFATELLRALTAPAILVAIICAHAFYFWANRSRCAQQEIELHDLTCLEPCGRDQGGITIVHGEHIEFDALTRSSRQTFLSAPRIEIVASPRAKLRLQGKQTLKDAVVKRTLICGDDVELDGETLFHQPVKIGGDLIINGQATFLQPVIINGVLKINGAAHFAAGVVSKDDAFVRGSMAVGADGQQGWAVVRELALVSRLRLHGILVTERAVKVREAA